MNIPLEPERRLRNVNVSEPVLTNEPEKILPHMFESRYGLFHALKLVTSPSVVRGTEVERPLRVRRVRAKLYDLFRKSGDEAERRGILREAAQRDAIAKQYLTQRTATLSFEDLGDVVAQYAVIHPEKPIGEPPIMLLAGLSNAGASVAQIADELALRGRTVVLLPQPESAMAKVEERFEEAVKKSDDFTPHARYFRALIDAVSNEQLPDADGSMDIWAYSAACPEIARALSDPEFSRRVRKAVFISPAASATPSYGTLAGLASYVVPAANMPTPTEAGAVTQFGSMFALNADLPASPIAWGRRSPETKEDEALRTRIRDAFAPKLSRPSDVWTSMRVGDGESKNVVIVRYDGDYLTSASDCMFEPGKPLPTGQMTLVMARGNHPTPTMPRGVRDLLDAVEGTSSHGQIPGAFPG